VLLLKKVHQDLLDHVDLLVRQEIRVHKVCLEKMVLMALTHPCPVQ
jgi:hypothetical protein